MKHSLSPFGVVMSLVAVVTGYFSLGRIFLEPGYLASLGNNVINPYIAIAWLLGFAVTISVAEGVIRTSRKTECPECHQKFMFTRKRRRMTGEGTHRGYEITNYKSDWSCDNCHYQEKNVPEVVRRAIPEE